MKSFEIKSLGLEELSMSEKVNTNGGQPEACLLKVIRFLREAYREWRRDTFGI